MYQQILLPSDKEFKNVGNRKTIIQFPLKLTTGRTYIDFYYKGVLLVQNLGNSYFYLTSADIDRMTKYGIYPVGEGTRTLVLFPNNGKLSERACTQNGKRLDGYTHPMISENFLVIWDEQKDELDRIVLNPDTLIPYPELPTIDGVASYFVHAWDKGRGLPTRFSETPSKRFHGGKVWIDSRYDIDFGERPVGRIWSIYPLGCRVDTGLDWHPSKKAWVVRLGKFSIVL